MGKIVVGVDGSAASKRALAWAADQAKATGDELEIVTSWEIPTSVGWAPVFPVDYDPQTLAGRVLDEAIRSALGADPDIPLERVVEEGHPAPVLIAASSGADLVVMGRRGRNEPKDLVIGSVSDRVARHVKVPILLVP